MKILDYILVNMMISLAVLAITFGTYIIYLSGFEFFSIVFLVLGLLLSLYYVKLDYGVYIKKRNAIWKS